jgi:hypothetical protein
MSLKNTFLSKSWSKSVEKEGENRKYLPMPFDHERIVKRPFITAEGFSNNKSMF